MSMNQIETQDELTTAKGERALVEIWKREIDNAKKYHEKTKETAKKFQEIYESEESEQTKAEINNQFPIFWSNTQVLRPLLFSKLPKINITQANYNNNEIARIGSELIERLLTYLLKESDAENQIEKIRDTFLVQGIGIPRIVFVPPEPIEIKIKKKKEKPEVEDKSEDEDNYNEDESSTKNTSEDMAEGEASDMEEESIYDVDESKKSFKIEFVDYQDFLKSTEKEWDKLRWIAFKKYYSRKELVHYFGKKGETVPMTNKKYEYLGEETEDLYKLCEVWEIWDKENKICHDITFAGDGSVLKTEKDGYNLKNFFPIPMPMGLNESKRLLPCPLYGKYKHLANDLSDVHDRIASLVKQAKFTGGYTSFVEQGDVENIMNGDDGEFKPLKTNSNIDDARKLVVFKPLTEIANTITVLRQEKLALKNDIQEITGLSDIVRGYSIASETATAQQLKGNFAISRIQPLQKEVEFTIRDTLRLLAELAVEKLSMNELMEITGLILHDVETIAQATQEKLNAQVQEAISMLKPQDPQYQEKIQALHQQASAGYDKTMAKIKEDLKGYAIEYRKLKDLEKLLKSDKLRCVNIDIETDSTIKIDQNQEKQDRVAYIQTISGMVQAMAPVVQSGVVSKEALNEFIIFASKPFKVGRNLENFLRSNEDDNKPDAQEMMAQMEMQMRQKEIEMRQMELQIKQQESMGKLQIMQQEVDVKKAELLNQQNEFETKLEFEDVNKQADRESKRLDLKVKAGTEIVNEQIRNANQPTEI
jgi:hypothetical protein